MPPRPVRRGQPFQSGACAGPFRRDVPGSHPRAEVRPEGTGIRDSASPGSALRTNRRSVASTPRPARPVRDSSAGNRVGPDRGPGRSRRQASGRRTGTASASPPPRDPPGPASPGSPPADRPRFAPEEQTPPPRIGAARAVTIASTNARNGSVTPGRRRDPPGHPRRPLGLAELQAITVFEIQLLNVS